MKKITLFLFVALLLTGGLRAAKVSPETAATVARHFMERQGVKVQLTLTDCGVGEMYLFSAADGGFVLVASDDCARPILAYSLTSRFADTLPEHIASWLQGYAEEIALLRSRGEQASSLVRAEWDVLLSSDGQRPLYTVVVSPMLTTTWKQGSPYNTMCPTDSLNRKTISGCVAIAMAQVMKYWNHPAQGVGSYSYSTANCGTMSANFGATTYDWANMTDNLTSVSPTVNINAVAQLVYHVGVAVKMQYGRSSSGATTVSSNNLSSITGERALRTYFKYDKALHSVRRDVMGDSVWTALLEEELLAGRPVIFSGRDTSGGHAFVCDGGNDAGLYHFNWGWGGYCDGFYQIGALNPAPGGEGGNATSHYNMENKMIIGIQPDTVLTGTYTLAALPEDTLWGSVTGGGNYSYGDTVELTANASSSRYRFSHWDDGMCYNPRNLIMGGDRTLTAVYDSVHGDTLGYTSDVYVTSWGYSTARPFYWGIKLEPEVLAGHTHLDGVQAYVKEGTYWLRVYNGDTPADSTVMDSLSFIITEDGWTTLAFDSVLPINATQPVWITLYNDDITYPACAGVYCGHQLAAYGSSSGTSWELSSSKRSFLIRGIFHTSEISHQLTVQLADSNAGSVSGGGVYPEGLFVEIAATAAPCHIFSHWSDGVTENPRVVMVDRDTTFTAYFDTVVFHDTLVVDAVASFLWEDVAYVESGIYTHNYTSVQGCDSVVTLILTVTPDTTGIEWTGLDGVMLFPNPTEGIFTVSSDAVRQVELLDLTGRRLALWEGKREMDIHDVPAGIYIARVVTKDWRTGIYRIVKK